MTTNCYVHPIGLRAYSTFVLVLAHCVGVHVVAFINNCKETVEQGIAMTEKWSINKSETAI